MQNLKRTYYYFFLLIAGVGIIPGASGLFAQDADRPWMNPSLPPAERAELVLKQLTLDEKLALLHGNGMAHSAQWQMPLTHLANGGAGYVEGVERLGTPPLTISDAAYGVRDSGAWKILDCDAVKRGSGIELGRAISLRDSTQLAGRLRVR